jgi:putative membrane protein
MATIRRRQMLIGLAATAALATFSVPSALADEPDDSERRRADQEVRHYVFQQAAHGHAAVEIGQLALQRSQNEAVRQFAQRVVDERIPMTLALYDKAASSKLEAPEALQPEDAGMLTTLSGLSGPAFDQAYVQYMVLQLRSDIRLIERGTSAWRGGWYTHAKTVEPILKSELQQAEALALALGVAV